MKYLKTFNEAKLEYPDNEVINTVKDICLELEDDGFVVSEDRFSDSCFISIYKSNKSNTITQSFNIKKEKFKTSEVKEVIERIYNYIPSRVSDIYFMGSDYQWRGRSMEDLKEDTYVLGIEIQIYTE